MPECINKLKVQNRNFKTETLFIKGTVEILNRWMSAEKSSASATIKDRSPPLEQKEEQKAWNHKIWTQIDGQKSD